MSSDMSLVLSRGASAVEEDLMIVHLQRAHEAQMEAELCEMDRMKQEIKELKDRCRDSDDIHKWDLETAAALHEGVCALDEYAGALDEYGRALDEDARALDEYALAHALPECNACVRPLHYMSILLVSSALHYHQYVRATQHIAAGAKAHASAVVAQLEAKLEELQQVELLAAAVGSSVTEVNLKPVSLLPLHTNLVLL
jgi:hypothetical protein